MGNIFSGNRTVRSASRLTANLPSVWLSHKTLLRVGGASLPRICPSPDGWAMVCYQGREWPVRFDYSKMRFEGQRRWLLCPACEQRRLRLFIDVDVLACRGCLGLVYESQREGRRRRMFRKAEKIRARLGWAPGIISPDGPKPHRMHMKTFRSLKSELDALTAALLVDMNAWLEKAESLLE